MIPTLYEPFRHWSEKGSVYVLSDLHFDDADCKFMSPDWITPQEQIAIINGTVMKNDTFICLGDVGNPEYIKDIKTRKKILILGNHDAKGAYKNYFDEIYTGPLFIAEKILLSHEPVYGLPWCLNIHGHDHNNMEPYKEGCKHINLAANVCGYTPINLGKIIKDGVLADVPSIHRMTIDRQVERGKKMTSIELQLCDIQGRLFKLSTQRGISSVEFNKVFMKSATAKALDSTYNRMQWAGEEYLLEEVIDEAGDRFEKPGEVYAEELIYWIGYIYRYWHYVTGESSKEIYKQAPGKVMKQNYARLYMMTPEEVIGILKENN